MNSIALFHIRQINEEQIRQIKIHKWLMSEREGRDVGEIAVVDWVVKYAPAFRKWAEKVPLKCVGCGHCKYYHIGNQCENMFDSERIEFLQRLKKVPKFKE